MNRFVPMPVHAASAPPKSVWYHSTGGVGQYQTMESILADQAAFICAQMQAQNCFAPNALDSSVVRYCGDIGDPLGFFVPSIKVYSAAPETVTLQRWNGSAWANVINTNGAVVQVTTALPSTAPGALASGLMPGVSINQVGGPATYRFVSPSGTSRTYNIDLSQAAICSGAGGTDPEGGAG